MTRPDDTGTPRQLVLDIDRAPSFAEDEFLVSPSNREASLRVRAWPDWTDRVLLLVGPARSGKSHLAAIWAGATGAVIQDRGQAPDPVYWDGGGRCVVLEDCDRSPIPEPQFFHCLNLVRETEGWLLITARTHPQSWSVLTADLLSRLRRAPSAEIGRPDAELLKAVLVKLFADRQIRIEADVVDYAARHCEQSLDAIGRFVATVDQHALAEGRRITRPLAARTILEMGLSIEPGDDGEAPPAEGRPQGPT